MLSKVGPRTSTIENRIQSSRRIGSEPSLAGSDSSKFVPVAENADATVGKSFDDDDPVQDLRHFVDLVGVRTAIPLHDQASYMVIQLRDKTCVKKCNLSALAIFAREICPLNCARNNNLPSPPVANQTSRVDEPIVGSACQELKFVREVGKFNVATSQQRAKCDLVQLLLTGQNKPE